VSIKNETLQQWMLQLDGMIGALKQAVVIGGRTPKERELQEHLQDARLAMIEELESRPSYADLMREGEGRSIATIFTVNPYQAPELNE
jgi:cyclopropane fatty-acyl-phospholipid synthase-like methyltransferase